MLGSVQGTWRDQWAKQKSRRHGTFFLVEKTTISIKQNKKVKIVLKGDKCCGIKKRQSRVGRVRHWGKEDRFTCPLLFGDAWLPFQWNLIAKPQWIKSWQLNHPSGFEDCYEGDAHSHTRHWLSFQALLLILLTLSTTAGWVSCLRHQLVQDSEKHSIWFSYRGY